MGFVFLTVSFLQHEIFPTNGAFLPSVFRLTGDFIEIKDGKDHALMLKRGSKMLALY